jgi:plastocyanin
MNKILITVVILLIVGAGSFFLFNGSSNDTDSSLSEGNNLIETDSRNINVVGNDDDLDLERDDNAGNSVNEVKTIVMTGENFKFLMDGVNNPDIKLKKGDKVRIEFTSKQGFHDWVVDEFNAATKQVRESDGLTFVEFEANKTGTFEYYCSVGQHRANGMKGNLIVE